MDGRKAVDVHALQGADRTSPCHGTGAHHLGARRRPAGAHPVRSGCGARRRVGMAHHDHLACIGSRRRVPGRRCSHPSRARQTSALVKCLGVRASDFGERKDTERLGRLLCIYGRGRAAEDHGTRRRVRAGR